MDETALIMIAAIGGLLLVSSFFSGSETALTAASRPRLHQLEKSGDHRAVLVNRLRARQERVIGGILVGNNLVNIAASAVASSLAIGWFNEAGVAIATVFMTLLVVIFAEILPKTYALRHADHLALQVAPVLRVTVFVLTPVTVFAQQIVRWAFILFGGSLGSRETGEAREEELRGAIDLHAYTDEAAADEGYMLRSVLDLGDVDVVEIMTHRKNLEMIDLAHSVEQVIDQVMESPFTRLPVYQDDPDNVVGVLHAKELFRAVQSCDGGIDQLDIKKIASLPWFIPESTSLQNQLHAFRRRRSHFALVVDEYGALMGVVTLEDILEEIVGDIDDEHDIPVAGVRHDRGGSYLIDGSVTIRDLNREFGWGLPDEHAATLAGLVLHEARLIPETGQRFAFHGFRFEIVRRDGNQITSIRLSPRAVAVH
jgi:Mg2+/Co2+ transporter CorB